MSFHVYNESIPNLKEQSIFGAFSKHKTCYTHQNLLIHA